MHALNWSDILQMSVAERIRLVQDIWDSIINTPESLELTDQEKKLIDDRLQYFQANPDKTISWEEIKNSILKS